MTPFFDGLDELYKLAQFAEDRTTRAGCRWENVVLVFLCSLEGVVDQTGIALPFIGRFQGSVQRFFRTDCSFKRTT